MKRTFRQIAISLIWLLCLMALPFSVYADGEADFNGEGASAVWQYDTANVRAYGYDAFGDAMKNLYPGAQSSVNIRLRNNTSDTVEFRLVAWPLTGNNTKLKEAEAYYGKTANDSLLDVIQIDVAHGATPLYSGTLHGLATSGTPDMYATNGVSLGTVSAGYSGTVSVRISVPTSLDARAMDTLCAIQWQFVATQYNAETPPPPPPPGGETPPGGNPPGNVVVVAPGAGAGAVAPAPVAVDDTPIAQLPDVETPRNSGTPEIEVISDPVPIGPGAAWALFNLLLTILAGLQMLAIFVFSLIAADRNRRDNEEYGRADAIYERRLSRKRVAGLIGILGTLCAIVLFILTEDMRLPMEYINKYTIYYVVVNVIMFAIGLFSVSKKVSEAVR